MSKVSLSVDIQQASKYDFITEAKGITFLTKDEKNKLLSVCDQNSANGEICCFWDTCKITEEVYKCPIRIIYKGESTTYQSSINGNVYTIRDNVNASVPYYETDGYFCSEECMASFIDKESMSNPLYLNSMQLLCSILGREPSRAPDYRTLKKFGGTLSIEKFRDSFVNKTYILQEIVSGSFPFCYKFKEVYHV